MEEKGWIKGTYKKKILDIFTNAKLQYLIKFSYNIDFVK